MKENYVLPSRVVHVGRRKELEKELDERLRAAQSAYDSIHAMEDLGEVPTDPKDITSEWLEGVMRENVGGIDSLPMPISKKKEIKGMWDALHKQGSQYITTMQRFFEDFDGMAYEVKDGTIIVTNKDSILDEACMMIVPTDAQKHYELWCGVVDAIKELRTWERERNLKKFPLSGIIQLDYGQIDPVHFADSWCCGTFTKNAYESAPQAEAIRRGNESLYL